ncbi:MAG: hypothetical protein VB142_11505 [Burkholderia sp.]
MIDTQENQPVTTGLVDDDHCLLTFPPSYFGQRLMMCGEALVYGWLRRLSKDYNDLF